MLELLGKNYWVARENNPGCRFACELWSGGSRFLILSCLLFWASSAISECTLSSLWVESVLGVKLKSVFCRALLTHPLISQADLSILPATKEYPACRRVG